ncbi:hypothetical protein C8A00DRAFT_11284 [Chaetomidium leptoderma]|uniref:Uncharacterized protein n=1 Tax=Chaetomidium leptoderma TaxID=669021 RepID=A0AAN6VV85_9PEZI|nr:hypothetical protein C8A00DRAFT_11284 [Chaetomidium leptoderma]
MAGDDQSDPFLWDEDRVVQELCTPNRSWKAPLAKRLPDPAALEARLRDCGVDGESLLTYEDEFDFDKLWGYLGVKKLPHQLSLKEAITQFRRRSSRYREWKTQQLADSQLCGEEDDDMAIKSESGKRTDLEHTIHAVHVEATSPELTNPCRGVLSPALSPSGDRDLGSPPDAPETPDLEQEPVEGPPSKKRRIAPTTISDEPTGDSASAPILTEADMLLRNTTDTLLHAADSSGFLGAGILWRDQLTDPQMADQPYATPDVFAWVQKQIPPGRRIQVSAAMKRFFRSDRVDRLKPDLSREEDPPLPLIGDSDEESVDSETWREYQQEEEERLAREAREEAAKERLLSKEEVAEVVRNAIQELESQWVAEKKPKYDLRAWRKWQDARLNPDRLGLISSARRDLDHFVQRVALISRHIINQQWVVGTDVQRKVVDILEVTVFQKKHQAWFIDILESPRQPPKPATLPRLTPKPAKQAILDDDEEELTSDSDDMDAFIEYDDAVVPFVNDEMDIDSEPRPKQATTQASPGHGDSDTPGDEAQPTPKKIKTEKSLVATTPRRTNTSAPEVIEIDSSPSRFQALDQVPSLDDRESLEKIGEIGVDYWEMAKDSERLVAAVLCEWSQAKLRKILSAIQNSDHSELWAKYISPTIEDPGSAAVDSIAFLLCRLFDVFVNKSAKRIHGHSLRLVTCLRIRREGNSFAGFCAHLEKIIPLFLGAVPRTPTRIVLKARQKRSPSTQQTAEIRDPAEEHSTSEESSSDDVPAPSTKKRRRPPKRLDKNAADLRVGNLNFNEELARRKRQLRERIAEQGSVTSKLSRLIVNETKESDDLKALIYVNDHIGARIKDHQIDGVRFMWNQVVVDSSVRQGCLLAHTMGLGKTMQVITLLVVIAESSVSSDESIRSQIPKSLRESKTLILCPPSLVDNWHEELQMWAPGEVLGPTWRLDANSLSRRLNTIHDWASCGGVLIAGYNMFTSLVRGDEDTAKRLLETPNLVVGDEAHYLKNPDSQRHQATANFRTMNRIAMTGSPLTNNVMDYYSMINWVAPNYLADIVEFRQRFSNPIKEGLYADSEPSLKRKARKMLQILKATVDPKVHRRDIDVLFNELPRKKEFIITVALTKHQRRLYEKYIEFVTDPGRELITGQAKAWSLVAKLGLVLAHPFIFKTVAEAQKAKRNADKARSSISAKGQKTDEDDEDVVPQDILHDLLAAVAVREIEDYALSNKILVLLRILDECRKARDKVLVFSQSIPTLDYIENICKRQRVVYRRLDGSTPMGTRQDSVKKFNADSDSEVYLISTTAGGVGLNIHGANRVVIFDFKYTPAHEQQAIGRAYRLGQTKPVYVYWLTIGGTFEDTIHNNAVFKTQLASRVVDKKNPDPWSKRFAEYFAMPRELDQEDLSGAKGQDQVLDALLRSKDIRTHIRKITSTETFEKEEKFELTPEDKREVDEHVELELLRSQNPEEFRRRERERAFQSRSMVGMLPLQSPSFYQPCATNCESIAASQCTNDRSNRTVRIKVPEHLRDKRKPEPPAPTVVSGAASDQRTPPPPQPYDDHPQKQILTLNSDPALVSPPTIPLTQHPASFTVPATTQPVPIWNSPVIGQSTPAPDQSDLSNGLSQDPKAAAPPPILGTGTHFKTPPTASPSTLLSGPSTLGSPGTPSSTSAVLDFDFPDLLAVHGTLCQEGRHVRHHPNDLIGRVHGVLTRNKVEQLPAMDKLQNVKKCSRNPRFAEAMLSGYMEPEQLASLTRLEMEGISASLDGMAEDEFKHRVWTTKANLSVCTTGTKST